MSNERNEAYYESAREEAKQYKDAKAEDLALLLVLTQRQLKEVIDNLPMPKVA